MNKILTVLAVVLTFVAFNTNAKTLEERIANVETRYEQRLEKIDTMRAKEARKEVLKKHAREDADLKIQHLKDLDAVKSVKADKKVKAEKATKTSRKAKKSK